MATNLKELNRRIGEAKKKPSKPTQEIRVDLGQIVAAIENSKQPVVNLPDRRPLEYELEVTKRNDKGAIITAKITPKFREDS